MNEADRRRVVEVAQSWLGTRFHDCAGVKGVGVDCAHLLARVFEEAALVEPIDLGHYSPQFFMHRGDELLADAILKYAREIEETDVLPGDIVIYKIGRSYAHGAIIIDYPMHIIHAHKPSRRVVSSPVEHSDLMGCPRRYFTILGGES